MNKLDLLFMDVRESHVALANCIWDRETCDTLLWACANVPGFNQYCTAKPLYVTDRSETACLEEAVKSAGVRPRGAWWQNSGGVMLIEFVGIEEGT